MSTAYEARAGEDGKSVTATRRSATTTPVAPGSSVVVTATPAPVAPLAVTLRRDLPGFREARHFVLEPLGDGAVSMVARLRCTDRVALARGETWDALSFLVLSPGYLWPDYRVEIDAATANDLEVHDASDVAVLAIIHPREPLEASTANLYSPLVVNRRTGRADQLVPALSEHDAGWSVATPLPDERGE